MEFNVTVKVKEAAFKFKKWSVYRLAQKLDLPTQTVYSWSWGKTKPSYENLMRICNALGCTPNDLLGVAEFADEKTV